VRSRIIAITVVAMSLVVVAGYLVARVLDIPFRALITSCEVAGESTVRLDPEQLANAATITAVGVRRGLPARAVVVALATAMQESELRNLAGGDRDSIGLFQQRPSQGWGEPEQIRDPRYAAGMFYDHLVQVEGWEQMRVTDAAQAVQRSAFPEAYQQWADDAEILATALIGQRPGAVSCTLTDPHTNSGDATNGLMEALRLDWGEITVEPTSDAAGVVIPADDNQSGWRYAHWLVSHAEEQGVVAVRFDGQEWRADEGNWQPVDDATTDSVLAEVFTSD